MRSRRAGKCEHRDPRPIARRSRGRRELTGHSRGRRHCLCPGRLRCFQGRSQPLPEGCEISLALLAAGTGAQFAAARHIAQGSADTARRGPGLPVRLHPCRSMQRSVSLSRGSLRLTGQVCTHDRPHDPLRLCTSCCCGCAPTYLPPLSSDGPGSLDPVARRVTRCVI